MSVSKTCAGGALFAFLVGALLAMASSANAGDINFCNKTGALIYIAIAYPQTGGGFLSRGWMSIDDGECSIFDTALHVPTFYFRATGEWNRHGRTKERPTWGKGKMFAVWDNDNFQYYNAEERVLNSKLEEFTQGPTADNGDVAATVTFTPEGSETTISAPPPQPRESK